MKVVNTTSTLPSFDPRILGTYPDLAHNVRWLLQSNSYCVSSHIPQISGGQQNEQNLSLSWRRVLCSEQKEWPLPKPATDERQMIVRGFATTWHPACPARAQCKRKKPRKKPCTYYYGSKTRDNRCWPQTHAEIVVAPKHNVLPIANRQRSIAFPRRCRRANLKSFANQKLIAVLGVSNSELELVSFRTSQLSSPTTQRDLQQSFSLRRCCHLPKMFVRFWPPSHPSIVRLLLVACGRGIRWLHRVEPVTSTP